MPSLGTVRVLPDHVAPDLAGRTWSGFVSVLLYLGIPVLGNCLHGPVAVRLHVVSSVNLRTRSVRQVFRAGRPARSAEEECPGSEQVWDARSDDGASANTNLSRLGHLSGTSFRTCSAGTKSQVTGGGLSPSRE